MKNVKDLGYICEDCATAMNCTWPKSHIATFHVNICPYCKKNTSVCSTGDWDWPDGKRRGMRD